MGGPQTFGEPWRSVIRGLVRTGCRVAARSRLALQVEGLEHVPLSGPVVIVSHHYHHVWDGCALLAVTPRPLRFLTALDWVRTRPGRFFMEQASGMLGWPVVVRPDGPCAQGASAYAPEEGLRYLRRAARQAVTLLCAGEAMVIFPEGYPAIDSVFTLKQNGDDLLPFRPGFVKLVARVQRQEGMRVPVVPVGFHYAQGWRWRVTLRFGEPLYLDGDGYRLLRAAEERVATLSNGSSSPRTEWSAASLVLPHPPGNPFLESGHLGAGPAGTAALRFIDAPEKESAQGDGRRDMPSSEEPVLG